MSIDLTLFQGTAPYYSRYRSGYSSVLYDEIIKKAKLDKRSVVLDVGTGIGTIACHLAPYVKRVYALDSSPEMLDEAQKIAAGHSLTNIIFIEDIAEHIDQHTELEDIDLVTFGASLHWIEDVDAMYAKVAQVLKQNGWLSIQFGGLVRIWTEDPQHGWRYEVTMILKKYLGKERKAGDGFFKHKVSKKGATFEEKLLAYPALFTDLCRAETEHVTTWTPDRILGLLYSTSFARRDFFGYRLADFEDDIKALFAHKSLTEWQEIEKHTALMARRV